LLQVSIYHQHLRDRLSAIALAGPVLLKIVINKSRRFLKQKQANRWEAKLVAFSTRQELKEIGTNSARSSVARLVLYDLRNTISIAPLVACDL